jgi:hypothetical protein
LDPLIIIRRISYLKMLRAAAVIADTPVFIAGSGDGANVDE